MNQWYFIIGVYSRIDLSVKSDRFEVILGIVHELEERIETHFMWKMGGENIMFLNPEHCWGIWLGDIYRGLFWRATRTIRVETVEIGAPSFSWLALSTPVVYPKHVMQTRKWTLQNSGDSTDSRVTLSSPQLSEKQSSL